MAATKYLVLAAVWMEGKPDDCVNRVGDLLTPLRVMGTRGDVSAFSHASPEIPSIMRDLRRLALTEVSKTRP